MSDELAIIFGAAREYRGLALRLVAAINGAEEEGVTDEVRAELERLRAAVEEVLVRLYVLEAPYVASRERLAGLLSGISRERLAAAGIA